MAPRPKRAPAPAAADAIERKAMGGEDIRALDAADEALVASLDPAKYDIPEVRRRLAALRLQPPAPRKAARRRSRSGILVANAAMVVMGAVAVSAVLFARPLGPAPLGAATLDASLYTAVLAPRPGGGLGGLNGAGVDWAVFFYKPYCGACRRVRPFFRALQCWNQPLV